jgi:ABC-type nitrate/sulfonate/bicarbonate transport system substrate-binding protein
MPDDTLEAALGEAKKAAQELARASARLTRRLLGGAERAAQNPRDSVERAARRAAKELEAAAREIDELLKKI